MRLAIVFYLARISGRLGYFWEVRDWSSTQDVLMILGYLSGFLVLMPIRSFQRDVLLFETATRARNSIPEGDDVPRN